ncbi:hypothetical protein FXO38_35647 [Capsicum annuum]|nr:hypothetical protein FXO38_35647 [Capsicum annuum]
MPETTTANTRNGELRQEVDELREQTRIQEIRQLLITIVANQVPQRADGPVENAPTSNGFNFDQGSVQDFLDKLDELLNQVELTEEQSISIFLANLSLEVEAQVRMLGLQTLMKAYNQRNQSSNL